jgi:hypothetical protein
MKFVRRCTQSVPRIAGRFFFTGVTLLFAFALFVGLMSLSLSPVAWGQAQNTGTVAGNITDETGSIIPGADLQLVSVEHGTVRTMKSNERGEYLFSDVQVGTYKLKVSFNTFASYEVDRINVDADANVRIDAKLKPAATTTETTVVESGGTTIDTRSATIGVLLENKLVEDLPLDGGNVVAMAALLPGITGVNAPSTFTSERGGPTYTVSGSRNTQNLFLLDGTLWNNLYYNTGLNFPPRQGLQEVSVILNNFKAQYGRNAGSIYNVITKSGSNQIHGQVWEYFQNSAMNAADYMSHINNKDNFNQFGATIGGPIKKDKIFYFVTFQDLKLSQQDIGSAPTQTLQERGLEADGKTPQPCDPNGPFAGSPQGCMLFGTVGTTSTSNRIKNPLYYDSNNQVNIAHTQLATAWTQAGGTGTSPCLTYLTTQSSEYIMENGSSTVYDPELPYACFNPVMKAIINKYAPVPTQLVGGVLNAETTAPQPKDDYNGMVRVDWSVNAKHTLDVRFSRQQTYDKTATGVSSTNVGVPTYEIMDNFGQLTYANIGDTWVVSNNMLNVARLAYKRYLNTTTPIDQHTLNSYGGNFHEAGIPPTMPQINFNRYSLGSNAEAYADKLNESIEFDDNFSWQYKNHNFQAGFTGLRMQYLNRAYFPGVLQYSSTFTGNVIADGEAGLLNELTDRNLDNLAGIEHSLSFYAQDDWRATARLTLNLGLRYELNFPWDQPDKQSETFVPGYQSTVFPQAPSGLAYVGDKHIPRGLINPIYTGYAPRFGFAYDIFGNARTSLRGGYGIFFDALNAQIVGVGEPYYFNFTYSVPPGGASVPMLGYQIPPDTYQPGNPVFISPTSIFYPDPKFTTPYVQSFNLGIQQHLTTNSTLEINYVGRLGRHLTVPYDKNPAIYDCSGAYYQINPALYCSGASKNNYSQRVPYANFGYGGQGIVDYASIGTSSYNGLQVMFNMRSRKHLTMLATYTYSRSLDMSTNGQTNNNAIPNVTNLRSEYGPSDANSTHNLTSGWTYNLPILAAKDGLLHSSIVRAVANNWTFGGTYQIRTGLPITSVTMNSDIALSDEPNQRPYLIPGVNPYLPSSRHRQQKIAQYLNPEAFAYPATGTYSNLSRNKFSGPAYSSTNFTVGRQFPMSFIREGAKMDFRAEAYNVFNIPNLNVPNMEFDCTATDTTPTATVPQPCPIGTNGLPGFANNFDQITNTYGANSNVTTNGRKMQLSLTLNY